MGNGRREGRKRREMRGERGRKREIGRIGINTSTAAAAIRRGISRERSGGGRRRREKRRRGSRNRTERQRCEISSIPLKSLKSKNSHKNFEKIPKIKRKISSRHLLLGVCLRFRR